MATDVRAPADPTASAPADRRIVRRKRRRRLRRAWDAAKRPLLYTTLAATALAILAVIDLGVRYLPAARSLQDGKTSALQARDLLTAGQSHLDHQTLARARTLLAQSQADFTTKSQILDDGLLARIGSHVPILSGQIDATRALRHVGADGTTLGLDLATVLDKILPPTTPAAATPGAPPTPVAPTSALARATHLATTDAQLLTSITADADRLHADLATIPQGRLLSPLTSARDTAQRDGPKLVDAIRPAVSLLAALPAAVGPGTHRYLIAISNPGEERPGGGFIGVVGEVNLSDGALTDATFRPSSFSDTIVKGIPTPRALNAHLFRGHDWELSDANWSPDFPTSAADLERFYTQATGAHLDGTIEVDPVALGYVLRVLGPVHVDPYPQVITADNALKEINYIVNQARPGDPGKGYLIPFGRVMLDEILHANSSSWPALADALQRGARETHIVMHFNQPTLQKLIDGTPTAGRIPAPLSDSLLVTDANVSASKEDLFVQRRFSLEATVAANGDVSDHLQLTYTNPAPPTPADANLVLGSGGAYRDYVQVLVPETAQLHSLHLTLNGRTDAVSPESITWDHEREAIGFYIVIPRNGAAQLTLDYSGPFADVSAGPVRYTLAWERQLNALTWPIDVSVGLPNRKVQHATSDLRIDRELAYHS